MRTKQGLNETSKQDLCCNAVSSTTITGSRVTINQTICCQSATYYSRGSKDEEATHTNDAHSCTAHKTLVHSSDAGLSLPIRLFLVFLPFHRRHTRIPRPLRQPRPPPPPWTAAHDARYVIHSTCNNSTKRRESCTNFSARISRRICSPGSIQHIFARILNAKSRRLQP